MLARPLLVNTGMQLVLLGGGLVAAAFLLAPLLHLGWRSLAIALALYAVIAALILGGLAHHAPHRRFGVANGVTLTRAAYTVLLLGMLGGGVLGGGLQLAEEVRWIVVVAGFVALVLDGVDGWAARRTGLASAFGARFDMEVDALFVLTLAALVYRVGQADAWVLLSGIMRYIFVAAGWLWPALAAPLPPSRWRKTVCVIQVIALLVALAPPVGSDAAGLVCLFGLVLLSYSFGTDCRWLVAAARRPRGRGPGLSQEGGCGRIPPGV